MYSPLECLNIEQEKIISQSRHLWASPNVSLPLLRRRLSEKERMNCLVAEKEHGTLRADRNEERQTKECYQTGDNLWSPITSYHFLFLSYYPCSWTYICPRYRDSNCINTTSVLGTQSLKQDAVNMQRPYTPFVQPTPTKKQQTSAPNFARLTIILLCLVR